MKWQAFFIAVLKSLSLSADAADPVANDEAVFISGCARLTLLTDRLVRMERARTTADRHDSLTHVFDNRATYSVVNRRLRVPEIKVERTESRLTLTTSTLRVVHNHGGIQGDCNGVFRQGEVIITLMVQPLTTWTSSGDSGVHSQGRSSVAHILPNDGNLNGTMNYGPAFAGGLDCYSSPPDCAQKYRQRIGQGLLSRSGFAIVNDTNTTRFASPLAAGIQWFDPDSTRPSKHYVAEDLYFLASGMDYKAALRDWALVGGAPSIPPLAALGVWYSRYYPYGEETFLSNVIDKYIANDLPLSVGVLDVPWHNIDYPIADLGPDKNGSWPYPNVPGTAKPGHSCNGWDGFTFNRTLFPDPKRFFEKVHAGGMEMILSVHMQDGIDHCQEQYVSMAHAMGFTKSEIESNTTVSCTMDNKTYVDAFFRTIVEAAPVANTTDWWWLDYPGGASAVSEWDQQEPASLWWSNHMFAEHARSKGKRPVILARYGGLGQQRDGLGFSGDTFQEFSTLEFEVEMTPLASNVLFGWWSHDIGGNHNGGTTGYDKHGTPVGPYPGDEDPKNVTGSEMLLRWIQFGVFSPIFRTHCETTCNRYVWDFPHFQPMRAAMRLRDALVPYIYEAALHAYYTGISLLRPMYYEWPAESAAYAHPGQYMFGERILVAPIFEKSDAAGCAGKSIWLPPLKGNHSAAEWHYWNGSTSPAPPDSVLTARWRLDEVPIFVRAGTVIPLRTTSSTHKVFVDPVVWTVWPAHSGANSVATLFEDAGDGMEHVNDADGFEPRRAAHAAFTEARYSAIDSKKFTFSISPTEGSHLGQHDARQHLLQYRCSACRPEKVIIGKSVVSEIQPDSPGPGWYVASSGEDQRDHFTQPPGVLVIATGSYEINKLINIHVELTPHVSESIVV